MAIIQVGLKVVFFIEKNDGETHFAQLASSPSAGKGAKNVSKIVPQN